MTEYAGSQGLNTNKKDPPKVAIIILNWNGWKNTIECLESLYQIDYPTYEIILVDNGSKDDSVQKIGEYAKGEISVGSSFFSYDSTNKPLKLVRPPVKLPSGFNKELVLNIIRSKILASPKA